MANVVRAALVQCEWTGDKESMVAKNVEYARQAANDGAQILCFQEIFNSPYFCNKQDSQYLGEAEPVPDGPTVTRMMELAKETEMAIIVPLFEKEDSGFFYNSAAVIERDGTYLGKYRNTHIPHEEGFWEKYYFRPGNMGYPSFDMSVGRVGVYICYDRHFPEGWRALALNGAEYIVNPSATVAGLSKYLWELEQPASAAANGVFIGAINRVGTEEPWAEQMGEFYGSSYIVNPRGAIEAQASYGDDELLVHEIDLDMLREVRNTGQFFRDRRPETYGPLTDS